MDYIEVIESLRKQKEILERAIASLEELRRTVGTDAKSPGGIERRGRKSMPPEERQEVSVRMKRYWAARRKLAKKQKQGD